MDSWDLEVTTVPGAGGIDVRGPYVQGGPGAPFVCLSWGTFEAGTFSMFGRAKLLLNEVDAATMASGATSGRLVGRVGLVDEREKLRMAAVKPPAITWSAK
jgi:hypothetical protein